jgi:hypothetical protein
MAKLAVGPINKGLKTDRTAFNIDNDSFPTLINAYQWRGRIKRKRGTTLLGRLQRYIGTTDVTGGQVITIRPIPIAIGIATFVIGTQVFVDPGGASPVALLTNGPGTATLDRTTGILTINASIPLTPVIYFPRLPVMGIEELNINPNVIPGTIAFDTIYAYNISGINPYPITDISFYKNPATGTYPGYVQKSTWTPVTWNGQNYQQFWTVNYQGALWATNGVPVPFSPTNFGMQFKPIVTVTVLSPTTATLQITGHGLVVGDFVFVNEVVGTTGINFQTGYVITVTDANNVIVDFPFATIATNGTLGIAQYLTSRSDTTKDCIRWYDGDPTNGLVPPTFVALNGWVNFMPPLSQFAYSVAELPQAIYYLVGAKLIFPFKDRLLFIGTVVQTSAVNATTIYLRDTVVYSQNGTPYYTASYTNDPDATKDTPTSVTNVFTPILVPINQTATPAAWFEDQVGFGGFISAGVGDAIISVGSNEDVLLLGFNTIQTRLVYSGNDVTPFDFYLVNSELGTGSTFSAINMDAGIISRGNRGYIIASQTNVQRIDLEIHDQVFEISLVDNGAERMTAQRDFINEWIYFTYRGDQSRSDIYVYPTETLQYNYRDNSYALFKEAYTTYGPFKRQTGFTWASLPYATWNTWTTPWNAGDSNLLQVDILAGNQQGFILFRDEGTQEGNSLYIQNIVGSLVTSPDHCLNENDYIVINGVLGTLGLQVNQQIFSVANVTRNTFTLNPNIAGGTYIGGGTIKRMYQPFVQTKQFPQSWGMGRKTRIGPQQYLLTRTAGGQITVQIYLSQNSDYAFNNGPVIPAPGSLNEGLVFTQVVYTCAESTNLGLTPFNTNLQQLNQPKSSYSMVNSQEQIWHRMNTSLLGDTIQLGFTMSDAQMRDSDFSNQFTEIELHGFIVDVSSSGMLS